MDVEIPSLETDAEGPMTAAYAEQMWKRYLSQQPRMIERFRHCMGCVHLRQAGGSYLVCCYLLHTGHKRPTKFGSTCTVKDVAEGFEFPDGYLEWCGELDQIEEGKSKKRRVPGQRGRFAAWDTDYAKSLYDRGFAVSEISEIMGISKNTLMNYGMSHLWFIAEDGRKRKKNFPHATPEVIEAEREAFQEHLEKEQ